MPLSKKDIELHYLERFKLLLTDFPSGEIASGEEPDFVVQAPHGRLGIELTELHRDVPPGITPPQASEAMRHKVVRRAQEIFVAEGNPPVRCTVLMQEHHIQRQEVEDLATAIARIAVKNLPASNTSVREEFDWVNRNYFPEVLNSVTVHRLEGMTTTHFNCPGATWVATLSAADIERVIAAKESKYTAYRIRCDEAWLLVNADIAPMSTWFEFDSAALTDSFETSFQRVFVMRHFGNVLHEINLKPKSGV